MFTVFALMGTAIAHNEGTQAVENTPSDVSSLVNEIRARQAELDVISRLEVYGQALQLFEGAGSDKSDYYLLELDPVEKRVLVRGFAKNELAKAQAEYLETEKRTAETPSDAVLVSVDSVSAL